MQIKHTLLAFCIAGLAPAVMYGRSAIGAPTQRTGAPSDGGQTCAVCHTTFGGPNTDPSGKLVIQAAPYTPGVTQKIRVSISHPEAQRWGFELTARLGSDETQQAGRFLPNNDIQIKCGPSPGAVDACTDTSIQYPTHTGDSTHLGQRGGNTWEIDWTPPATDVGEVVFYAAGNAANGNGNNQGDHIYNTRLRIASAAGCPVSGAPKINAVVNGASFQPGIGFNTMFTIFGTGFAPAGFKRNVDNFDFVDDRFPRQFSCVTVEVNGIEVPLAYVDANQINAEAPAQVMNGRFKVEVKLNKGQQREAKAELENVAIQQFAPAFFAIGSSKSIAARHSDSSPVADASLAAGGTPAKPGEEISLFATGLGVTNPVWQAGERPTDKATVLGRFTVTVGSVTLRPEDVTYVGLSPQSISGLYQVNLRVPDSASDGNVPVVLRIEGSSTQDGMTIPVKR